MRLPSKVQISDLKPTESFVEGELTLEEAEKIVGGSGAGVGYLSLCLCSAPPICLCHPDDVDCNCNRRE